jgi:hypothetical protein
MTRKRFASLLLDELGVPDTLLHIGARRFLTAWMHAESGEHPGFCNGVPGQGAKWNPLNTTLQLPGSTFYNNLSTTTGVQNYKSSGDGTRAVAITLRGDARYADFLELLAKPGVFQRDLADAIDKTPWGTHQPLIGEAVDAYNRNRKFFNTYPIGPK